MLIDIMNPAETLEGATPVIIERGPYVYHVLSFHVAMHHIIICTLLYHVTCIMCRIC